MPSCPPPRQSFPQPKVSLPWHTFERNYIKMIYNFTATELNEPIQSTTAVTTHEIVLEATPLPSPPSTTEPPTPPPVDDVIDDEAEGDMSRPAIPPLPPPPPPLPVITEDGFYDSMSSGSVFSSVTDRPPASIVTSSSHPPLAPTSSNTQPLSSISIHDLQSVQLRKTDNKLAKSISAPLSKCYTSNLSPNGNPPNLKYMIDLAAKENKTWALFLSPSFHFIFQIKKLQLY